MKLETDLSTLSLAILGLISQRPLTGYDLRKVFLTTPMGHFSSSPGAIYPALRRIEEAGWIRSVAAQGQTRRQRVVYEITACGLETLQQHLSRPVTSEDVVWHMDDLMMRFAFMDGIVGRERTVRFLEDFASQIDAHVADLRRYFEGAKSILPACGKLAMENGIQSYEMNAQWARRAIKELQ
ncbi:MAG: PadR family transcriptional regulator [Phycisphaerae bacterium]|nr:PadR family transcriptional regulator [Phycisphaerae bacterium]